MGNESGTWIMHGVDAKNPLCIHNVDELTEFINKVGFIPLFKNEIDGFSVEERTQAKFWWTDDPENDPWEWRKIIAERGEIAYGKFFDKKAGFISKEWLPYFANHRRDGYDFDALWDDEKASFRQKKIMDLFTDDTELFSNELKAAAGFTKGGEKNFEGVLTELQGKIYLCVREFRQRLNKKGEPYGWPLSVYCKPEHIFGYELVSSAYKEAPEKSRERIISRIKELYPDAGGKMLERI